MDGESPEALEPDSIVTSEERLFPYNTAQAAASGAVKPRRRGARAGRRGARPPSAERQNEGRRR